MAYRFAVVFAFVLALAALSVALTVRERFAPPSVVVQLTTDKASFAASSGEWEKAKLGVPGSVAFKVVMHEPDRYATTVAPIVLPEKPATPAFDPASSKAAKYGAAPPAKPVPVPAPVITGPLVLPEKPRSGEAAQAVQVVDIIIGDRVAATSGQMTADKLRPWILGNIAGKAA